MMGLQLRELASWARNRKWLAMVLVMLTLSIGILIGTLVSGRASATRSILANGGTPLVLPSPIEMSHAFSGIVKRDQPAIVNISTTQVIDRGTTPRQHGGVGPDPFQDFFNRFFDAPSTGPEAERSLGSGMLTDKKGFILTNRHVIEQATKIQVQLDGDPTLYTAKLVGEDLETDLAVIKIDLNRELPTVILGNSDGVQVGDWVLAIGSPFGLQSTVTAGIISATDRGGVGRQFQHFLQTDAAINPGNSGGPLVDLSGQVIGINTAIMSGGRGYEGVGFALPSKVAIGVYNQIIEHGKVIRGSIGVSFTEDQSKNPIVLHELGADYGMVLQSVEPGGPADRAGIKAGDVITAINGHRVKSGSDLVNPISDTPIGEKAQVSYLRDHEQHEATVTVEDRTKLFPDRGEDDATGPSGGRRGVAPTGLGLQVEELKQDKVHRAYFEDQRGVLVIDVAPASFAEGIGFFRGDLIAAINEQAVASVSEYNTALAALKPGQRVIFKVLRHDETGRVLTVYVAGVVPTAQEQ
jgi:serine protease Do